MPEAKTGVREVRFHLTPEELADRAQRLAAACNGITELDERHADIRAGLKAERKEAVAEWRRLTRVVSEGAEWREVAVEERPDYSRRCVDIVRMDTGEILESRAMTDDERQTSFLTPDPRREDVLLRIGDGKPAPPEDLEKKKPH